MRTMRQLTALAFMITLGTVSSFADQTNLAQDLGFELTGYQQGATATNGNIASTRIISVRLRTRDIMSALGSGTGMAFSKAAKLVVVTPLGGGPSSIQIRDGTATVDVTAFFGYQAKAGTVSASQTNLRTGRAAGDDFSIQSFILSDSPGYAPLTMHFDLRGMASENWATTPAQGTRSELTAEVTGSGDSNGNTVILRGIVRVHGYSLEVVSGGWTT